jgi:hypothetical protein
MLDWLGLGWIDFASGGIIIAAIAVIFLIPPLRGYAIAAIGLAVVVLTIYRKGKSDQAALERKRRDEAVRRAKEEYDEIDRRRDDPESVRRKLSDGSF